MGWTRTRPTLSKGEGRDERSREPQKTATDQTPRNTADMHSAVGPQVRRAAGEQPAPPSPSKQTQVLNAALYLFILRLKQTQLTVNNFIYRVHQASTYLLEPVCVCVCGGGSELLLTTAANSWTEADNDTPQLQIPSLNRINIW